MKKKIADIYNPKYMKHPLINKSYTKFIFALLFSMLWFRLIDKGQRGLGPIFFAMGVILFALAWFNYLALDGVKIGHLMSDWKIKKPKTNHWNKDIADFIDEEVIDYEELDEDEKLVIQLYSNLIIGALFIVLSVLVPFVQGMGG